MRGFALLLLLLVGHCATAQPAYDAFSTNSGSGFGTSWTHTPAGTPRGVTVTVLFEAAADTASGITYGGQALSFVCKIDAPATGELTYEGVEVWFLGAGLPAGAQTIAISGSTGDITTAAYTVTASDDTETVDCDGVASDAVANPTVTLAASGREVFASIFGYSGQDTVGGITPNTNWTQRYEQDYGTWTGLSYSYDIIATSDVAAAYTQTANDALYAGVLIAEEAAGSAPTLSSPTPSGTIGTQTTATLGATSNDNTGTFYGVVDTDSLSGITATQIKAEQDAGGGAVVDGCNASVSTTSPSCGITGLTANTAYNYAVVHNNANGDSNVLTGAFTTAAGQSPVPLILQQIAANDDEYDQSLVANAR